MSKLKMPAKGQSAAMLAALQAEHASPSEPDDATNVTTLQRPNERTASSAPPSAAPSPVAPSLAADPITSLSREERLAHALGRASQDEIAVVTVRVPAHLNRYMDDFVARANRVQPKGKYRKQDAVAEAFAAFYADHPMPPAPPDEELS
ncbi:MAG: hypothetical protein KBA64_02020 [Armatimonadetes bacterium]|nr:hypothetical protein [Armatimonadota bacterium]